MSPNRPHSRDNAGAKRKNGPREYRDYRQKQNQPRHPDKEVDQRIRELDAERDPLSLPEEIVSETNKAGERKMVANEKCWRTKSCEITVFTTKLANEKCWPSETSLTLQLSR